MNASSVDDFQGTDRFVVRRQVGGGGMGIVYQAYDRDRDELVAIKVLRECGGAEIYRLKKEFRTLADLIHPNLVKLYELFSDAAHWFFTMEFIEGTDFLTHIRLDTSGAHANPGAEATFRDASTFTEDPFYQSAVGRGDEVTRSFAPFTEATSEAADPQNSGVAWEPLSPPHITRLRSALCQLGEGVFALHKAGKLHRDIKPSNVLVTDGPRVVLLDFGLASDIERETGDDASESGVVGTAAYMAPEQAAGHALTPASDWYSVGVMLYEVLTGRRPFVGSRLKILMDKQNIDPPEPSSLVPSVPEDLNALCVQLLRRDPRQRPTGEEILRQAGSTTIEELTPASSRSSSMHQTPFVGRQQQLETLADALSDIRLGRAVVVNIHGRSGLGKTAIVERFLRDLAESDDVVVLTGRCYQRESVPYKAVDGLVDALSRYLSRLSRSEVEAILPRQVFALAKLFPVLRRVEGVAPVLRRKSDVPDQQELRQRAFHALRELLARLGDRKVLVMAIDDLQWGDLDSVALLNELLSPPDPPVFLLLVVYRSEDASVSPILRTLLDSQRDVAGEIDIRDLAVGPLEHSEARSLATKLLDSDDVSTRDLSERIARESGGNPYFVDALVQQQNIASFVSSDSTTASEVHLDEVLWSRVGELPDTAIRLLQVVSVAGHPVRQFEAFQAADLESGERTALDTLRIARLIRSTGKEVHDEVETYHDRIRESVVSHLSPERLRQCHDRLAATLEVSGNAEPAELAVHFLGAENREKAGEYYALAAAGAADALAFDRAANLYRLALELHCPDDPEERRLRTKLGDALANAGRGGEASREYQRAASGATAADALELRRRAAMQSLISGHIDNGLAALQTVLHSVGMKLPETPRQALWSLLVQRAKIRLRGLGFRELDPSQISAERLARIDICWTVCCGLSIVDTVRGADFQSRGLLLALQAGEPYRIARALALEAGHVATDGRNACQRVERLLEAATALAQRVQNPHAIGLVDTMQGLAAFLQGRWKRAVEFCDRAESIFRNQCTGVAWEMNTVQGFALWSLFYLGDVAEITRRLPALTKEAQDRGNLYSLNNLGTFARPFATLAVDEPDRAQSDLSEVTAKWSQQGFHVQHLNGLYGQIQIDIYRGDGAAAWAHIEEQWPALARSLLLRVQQIRVFMWHGRGRCALAAASLADADRLLHFVKKIARRLGREKIMWATAFAELLRAGVAAKRGDDAGAVALLKKAIDHFDRTDMALYSASCRSRLGQLLGGEGGRAMMDEAEAWMAGRKIANTRRMIALHTPGFPD